MVNVVATGDASRITSVKIANEMFPPRVHLIYTIGKFHLYLSALH